MDSHSVLHTSVRCRDAYNDPFTFTREHAKPTDPRQIAQEELALQESSKVFSLEKPLNLTLEPNPCPDILGLCTGTLVRGPMNDIRVEDLRIGDRIRTVSGDFKVVRWTGVRSYGKRYFRCNPKVWPIRMLPGALGTDRCGDLVPQRDLLVSPHHGMLIRGVLVPAALLVNGRSIKQDGGAGEVAYWVVELSSHQAIWAEGAAAETFCDEDSRYLFRSVGGPVPAQCKSTPQSPRDWAPRMTDGPALHAVLCMLTEEVGIA